MPASMVTEVPGDSAPGNMSGLGELPVTTIVRSPAEGVPPLSFTTCFITISVPAWSLLVIVQALTSPTLRVTEPVDGLHFPEMVAADPYSLSLHDALPISLNPFWTPEVTPVVF